MQVLTMLTCMSGVAMNVARLRLADASAPLVVRGVSSPSSYGWFAKSEQNICSNSQTYFPLYLLLTSERAVGERRVRQRRMRQVRHS